MPIYKYATIEPDGSEGEIFEVDQPISSPPLRIHPENGKPVRHLFDAPNINIEYTPGREKSLSDMSKIRKSGFRVLKKDKITGKHFEEK